MRNKLDHVGNQVISILVSWWKSNEWQYLKHGYPESGWQEEAMKLLLELNLIELKVKS